MDVLLSFLGADLLVSTKLKYAKVLVNKKIAK